MALSKVNPNFVGQNLGRRNLLMNGDFKVAQRGTTFAAAASTTGSPTITVAGGYRVYKWTGSGSITF